jgi:hypothetical protein
MDYYSVFKPEYKFAKVQQHMGLDTKDESKDEK